MTERQRYWIRWWSIVGLLAVLIYAVLTVAGFGQTLPPCPSTPAPPIPCNPALTNLPPAPTPPPSPPAPPGVQHPMCPDPFVADTTSPCVALVMEVGRGPRWFTPQDVGKPLTAIDPFSWCEGKLTRGAIRYYTTGNAPSSVVGILLPPVPGYLPPERDDPDHTLEGGEAIVLYRGDLVRGFKAVTATSDEAELVWTCQF